MATSGTFYLDAPSLSTATVVYSNAALTTVAANGFYSQGGIVREQVSGVLLPQQTCASCSIPCDEITSLDGDQGVYYLNVDLGATTGAIIVEFNPNTIPNGIIASFNSVIYNGLSSQTDGWRQGTAGLPTYLGRLSAACSSTLVSGSPYTLDEFQYDGTEFAPLGTEEIVTIASGQLKLTSTGPGNCVMVIPKTAASPSILNLKFIGPCTGTEFTVYVACANQLESFSSSTVNASSELACADGIEITYYVAHVNGSGGTLGLYDLVFSDPIGQSKLAAGYYYTNDAGANNWYQVDANGVIIGFGVCPTPPDPPVVSYNCIAGTCVDPGNGTGIYSTLIACQTACSEFIPCGIPINTTSLPRAIYYLDTNLGSPRGAVIVRFNALSVPDGILAVYNGINYNGLSSPIYGWRQGTAGLPTYVGQSSAPCGIGGILAGSPYTLNEYEYNGTIFAPLGTTETVTVSSGQLQLTTLEPGNCVMVIPKPTAGPSLLSLTFIGPCASTLLNVSVDCPTALPSFASSTVNESSALACSSTISSTYYVAYVTGGAGVLGLHDLVFSDSNGQFKLGAGYYKTTAAGANNWYRVDANGVIIQFGTCP